MKGLLRRWWLLLCAAWRRERPGYISPGALRAAVEREEYEERRRVARRAVALGERHPNPAEQERIVARIARPSWSGASTVVRFPSKKEASR